MVCCPETHPVLASWPSGGCRKDASSEVSYLHATLPGGTAGETSAGAQILDPKQIFPAGCASGNSTGNPELDKARCVVVAIMLGANHSLISYNAWMPYSVRKA